MSLNYSEFVKLIESFISTLLATFIGGMLAYKLNLKLQSKVVKKQIRIQGIKQILMNIYDYKMSLLILQMNYVVYHDNKSKMEFIKERLHQNCKIFEVLEKELYLNEIMFEEYGITVNNIKKDSNIIIDIISYKIDSYDEKLQEYEDYIKERSIKDRIDDLIKKLEGYIRILQKEYIRDL